MKRWLALLLTADLAFGAGYACSLWIHWLNRVHLPQAQLVTCPPGTDLVECLLRARPQSVEKAYESATEAALDVLNFSYQHLPYYEAGGVIFRKDGKFYTSAPETQFAGDQVGFDEDPASYDGEVVATYHDHPCLSKTHIPGRFSDRDLETTRISHTVGYMLDLCTGELHVWDPGVDKNDEIQGRIVGHVPVRGITPPEDGTIR